MSTLAMMSSLFDFDGGVATPFSPAISPSVFLNYSSRDSPDQSWVSVDEDIPVIPLNLKLLKLKLLEVYMEQFEYGDVLPAKYESDMASTDPIMISTKNANGDTTVVQVVETGLARFHSCELVMILSQVKYQQRTVGFFTTPKYVSWAADCHDLVDTPTLSASSTLPSLSSDSLDTPKTLALGSADDLEAPEWTYTPSPESTTPFVPIQMVIMDHSGYVDGEMEIHTPKTTSIPKIQVHPASENSSPSATTLTLTSRVDAAARLNHDAYRAKIVDKRRRIMSPEAWFRAATPKE